jgi:hypothetical protein
MDGLGLKPRIARSGVNAVSDGLQLPPGSDVDRASADSMDRWVTQYCSPRLGRSQARILRVFQDLPISVTT